MDDSGVVGEFSAYWVHRHYIFRIVVPYGCQIAKLARYCLIRCKQICYLHIYRLASLSCYKINFTGTEYSDIDIIALRQQVQINCIFHNLLYTAPHIESTKIVAKPMIGKIVFVD